MVLQLNAAAVLAIEDAGSVDGHLIVDTTFIAESSMVASSAIKSATRLLQNRDLIAVLGHSNSSASLAASQLYNDAHVVQLAPSTTSIMYSNAGRYSFRMVPSDRKQGRVLALAAVEEPRGPARIALLYANDDYGRSLRSIVRPILDSIGATVAIDLPHLDSDGRTGILVDSQAIIEARPNVILWLGRPPTLRLILPSVQKELGPVPVLAGDAMTSWAMDERNRKTLAGVRYIDFVDLTETPEVRAFVSRYMDRYGRAPGSGEILTYDATMLILAAVRNGARTGEEVRQFLTELGRSRPPLKGLSGPLFFSADGEIERSPLLLRIPVDSSTASRPNV